MLLHIPRVLTESQIARGRPLLEQAKWVDGRATAGHLSARAKHNLQVAEGTPEARELGEVVVTALERTPLFMSAALPLRVFPPLFNRYEPGMTFGAHVDNAIRQVAGSPLRVRADLSATLFLSAPEEYDGGDLVVDDTYGAHSVKLPAGDPRRPARLHLLGPEHGARRRRARPALRPRHGHRPGQRGAAGPPRSRRAHQLLPQPPAPLGRRLRRSTRRLHRRRCR